jgi:t-SNARE complex subunit (syntaxin)
MDPGKLTEFWYPFFDADTLWPMPPEHDAEHAWRDERGWREYAASTRERIIAAEANAARLEGEIRSLRQRQHELGQSVGLVQVLAEQVRNIAADVNTLTTDVREATDRLARAVERPTAPLIVQFLALVVAVAAIVVAVTR